jgi:3-hydroxyisobutyrate dehydrogenase-like beta-hydroxyacid dehydrogenase
MIINRNSKKPNKGNAMQNRHIGFIGLGQMGIPMARALIQAGYSWSMNAHCPAPGIGPDSPSDHDYKPGFSADLMPKDLGLAIDAASDAGADPRIGECARQIYSEFVETTGKEVDFSAILPWLNNKKPRMS